MIHQSSIFAPCILWVSFMKRITRSYTRNPLPIPNCDIRRSRYNVGCFDLSAPAMKYTHTWSSAPINKRSIRYLNCSFSLDSTHQFFHPHLQSSKRHRKQYETVNFSFTLIPVGTGIQISGSRSRSGYRECVYCSWWIQQNVSKSTLDVSIMY